MKQIQIRFTLLWLWLAMCVFCAPRSWAAEFNVASQTELVAAINTANGNSEADLIRLTRSFQVTATDNLDFGPSAFPVIQSRIEIDGQGFSMEMPVVFSNNINRRFFAVVAGGDLLLRRIRLQGGALTTGSVGGNAIYLDGGRLSLFGVQVTGSKQGGSINTAAAAGAILALNAAAPLQIEDCVFSDNYSNVTHVMSLDNSDAVIRRSRLSYDLGSSMPGSQLMKITSGSQVLLDDVRVHTNFQADTIALALAQSGTTVNAVRVRVFGLSGFVLTGDAQLQLAQSMLVSSRIVQTGGSAVARIDQVRGYEAIVSSISPAAQVHIRNSTLLRATTADEVIDTNMRGTLTVRNSVLQAVGSLTLLSQRIFERNVVVPTPTMVALSPDNIIVGALQFPNLAGNDGVVGTEDDDYRRAPFSLGVDDGDATALPADTFDLDGDDDVSEPLPLDVRDAPRIVGIGLDRGAAESGATVRVNGADAVAVQEASPGIPDVFTVALDREPSDVVVVTVQSDSQCQVTPAQLIFYPSLARTAGSVLVSTPWNVSQSVEVRAIDDSLFEPVQSCQLSLSAQSNDSQFAGAAAVFSGIGLVQPNQVRVTVIDDDQATDAVFANDFE